MTHRIVTLLGVSLACLSAGCSTLTTGEHQSIAGTGESAVRVGAGGVDVTVVRRGGAFVDIRANLTISLVPMIAGARDTGFCLTAGGIDVAVGYPVSAGR